MTEVRKNITEIEEKLFNIEISVPHKIETINSEQNSENNIECESSDTEKIEILVIENESDNVTENSEYRFTNNSENNLTDNEVEINNFEDEESDKEINMENDDKSNIPKPNNRDNKSRPFTRIPGQYDHYKKGYNSEKHRSNSL